MSGARAGQASIVVTQPTATPAHESSKDTGAPRGIVPHPSISVLATVAPIARMPALDWSLRGIAYHEAGHAVLMHLFRLRQNGAEANASGGKVYLDMPPAEAADVDVPPAQLQLAAVRIGGMYMAGVAAQMFKDAIPLEGVIFGNSSDWVLAERALDEGAVKGSATGRLFFCQQFAMAVLSRHWPAVVAVATALEQRGTLTAYEVAALCKGGAL